MVFQPSIQQQAIFDAVSDRNGGSLIIEAVAGAGKTTTLVKALELMSGNIFLGAYNSKMAKELKERTGHLANVRAGTFHSAGFNALRYAYKDRLGKDVNDKKVINIVDRFLGDGTLPANLADIATLIAKTVSMAKQRGLGALTDIRDMDAWEAMLDQFGLTDDLPEWIEVSDYEIINASIRVLEKSNTILNPIDFDDMVYLPLVFKLRLFPQDWVLIDEAQDTNPTRRALAARMLKPGGRVIAVGDPRQAIYGFTGADNDALEQIAEKFNCARMPLTVSYRCPQAVVAHARNWVSHITAADTAPEGSFSTMNFADLNSTVKPGDMVLCRFNKYLVSTCFALIRQGTPARIEGRAIGADLVNLIQKWKITSIDALETRIETWMLKEVKKALDKEDDQRAARIADRGETVKVLIERARELKMTTIAQLAEMTMSMFDDRVADKKNMVTLCSVHRSKGLENPRVFILGRGELMGRQMRRQWQSEQEINLIYVAVTRAQEALIEVVGVA